MNRAELSRFVGVTGSSLGQVEKDYFQHILLSAISRHSAGELVFKGGTALQKMGYVDRFSEDLDFTASDPIDIERIIRISLKAVSRYNYSASIDKMRSGEDSSGFRLRIEGPLYRRGKGICTIIMDISTRETIILPPELREYSPVYPNISSYILKNIALKEILAEKIRAIMTRKRPRDLYDLSMLIKGGIEPDVSIVQKKMDYNNLRFDHEIFMKRVKDLEKSWRSEMDQLNDSGSGYHECLNLVKKALES
ncbi:MAG: nucleotidyl transferase AbiEii/AbiGii toxin family protein [Thermoplasmatota archaeon]